ncbi:helix-turn-helix and ligand-binding sensor domain-containing protein [Moheibacter sediminis]|uniref:Y_Y_Y domain-containing protein n=1 Tax=Moheibacter sediminis TaxID=1434700 RepID=A0A1W2CGV3_9FLAO|nr:triple tyrosine motif-containing protein [Moheibacter sediminis]SMC84443.1 Y_Y_Y domain-containing protein [Moheibacter sediminis]
MRKISALIFILLISSGFGQELPPIIKFSKEIYNGGNQNWMISEAENHFIYVANNKGLLEYDGERWRLYESPNKSIIRSVKVVKDKIYTGCYREFGYWKKQLDGSLKYFSISSKLKNTISEDEQFWNIIDNGEFILFQSLNHLYIFHVNSEKINIISTQSSISKVFQTGKKIFYQVYGEGLYEIVKGDKILRSNHILFKDSKVVSIFEFNNKFEIHFQYEGIYTMSGNELMKLETPLPSVNLYSSIKLQNGNYAIGTVSNGVYITDENYNFLYHIEQSNGLSNNTILSLHEDVMNNLWLGLDNGLDCINLNSFVMNYDDINGVLGTVYASVLYKGNLYLGTNQGLFVKKHGSNNPFEMVSNTKGQVWALFLYEDTLFCGHDLGTFIVENKTAHTLQKGNGTWKFSQTKNLSLLLAGNYEGLSVLEKKDGQWKFRNRIENYNISSRFFEILNEEIYVNHEYKGIFRLKLDDELTKVNSIYNYKSPEKGNNSSIAKFNNTIYYASEDGIFELITKSKKFERDEKLSKVFDDGNYISGKLISQEEKVLWIFGKDNVNRFESQSLTSDFRLTSIPVNYIYSNSLTSFENISQLNQNLYLIGNSNGYITLDLDKIENYDNQLYLNEVIYFKTGFDSKSLNLTEKTTLKNKENNLIFHFSVPQYSKMTNVEYRYRLEGSDDNKWSDWSELSFAEFANLSWGDYTFYVQARVGYNELDSIKQFSFQIRKPWFISNVALVIYFGLLILLAWFINKTYKKYYERQNEKLIQENHRRLEMSELESQQQIMKLKNEQLETDFENKSKELATSTMNIINKNEILNNIRENLEQTDNKDPHIKKVLKIIEENLNDEDTWNLFVETFNNTDKDFLKKIKELHPSLTPNDLKLCAYLRLNLSSKEIASLLNITIRSVEVKRYRLRKKMQLDHEDGLVEYILQL